jgi:hypothetical protein
MKYYLLIKDSIRKWNTICLSKIMKLNITGHQGNINKMGHYPLSKVGNPNSTDYQDNMTRQTKHHRLLRWYGKMGHYPLSKVEKSNITNYQSNTKRLEIICLSKIMKPNIGDYQSKWKDRTLPVIQGREVKFYWLSK